MGIEDNMSGIFGSLKKKHLENEQTQKDLLKEIRAFVKVSFFVFQI
jgi:hypothetical protein